jgi:hypothetical protein
MMHILLLLAVILLEGCANVQWIQEGKSRMETRQDLAHCAEGLWKERKITVDTSSEERAELIAPCMEEKGYRKRS